MLKKAVKRKCIACNEIKNTDELIKITRDFNSCEIIVNPDNFTFGRSFYICKNENCVENAFKKNKIFKIMKTKPINALKDLVADVMKD